MKKTISIILVIGVISGFLVGLYLYKTNQAKSQSYKTELIAKTDLMPNNDEIIDKLVSSNDCKITPNTRILEKVHYKDCHHTISIIKMPDEALVNLNEEEFIAKYPDWEVQSFSSEEVIIYKEEEGFCKEHYLLKSEYGTLVIYELDNKDEIVNLFAMTDISTEVLPDEDKISLENGIKVYTKKELNKIIEDFE